MIRTSKINPEVDYIYEISVIEISSIVLCISTYPGQNIGDYRIIQYDTNNHLCGDTDIDDSNGKIVRYHSDWLVKEIGHKNHYPEYLV